LERWEIRPGVRRDIEERVMTRSEKEWKKGKESREDMCGSKLTRKSRNVSTTIRWCVY
jgi:hypothetical protein